MRERTNPSLLSTAVLYLKQPNPFRLRSLVLHFLLFPILIQIPILFLLSFLLFEPLGVERKLWEKIEQRAIRLRSRSSAGNRDGDGSERSRLNVRDLVHSSPYSFLPHGWPPWLSSPRPPLLVSCSSLFASTLQTSQALRVSDLPPVCDAGEVNERSQYPNLLNKGEMTECVPQLPGTLPG